MTVKENDQKSAVMIISSMLIFGSIGIFRRFLPLSSAFIAFSRGILGGVFILVFLKARHYKVSAKIPLKKVLWLSVTGAIMAFNWILLFEAYNHTSVAVATLCYYMQPTIVVLLSPLIFKEKLTGKKSICALIAIIGMVLVSGVLNGSSLQSSNAKGIILGLGAAMLYSAVVLMNKHFSGIDAYLKTIIQLLSAGLVMIPYLLITNEFTIEGLSLNTFLLLLVVGLVHTGIAYVLYFGSMDGLTAQSVAIFSYIDPVSALFFSAILLKEPLDAYGLVGALMIIGSAIVSEIKLKR